MSQKIVLHLVNGLRLLGAERVATEIAQRLSTSELIPVMGLVNGGESLRADIAQHCDNQCLDIVTFSGFGGAIGTALRIAWYCRVNNVSVIHSHGYKSDLMSLVARFANSKVFLLATNHNYIVSSFKERVYCWLDTRALKRFDRVVAVSGDVKNEMVDRGLCAERISIIDNGVGLNHLPSSSLKGQICTEFGLDPGSMLMGIVASLTPEKSHMSLFDAFAAVKEEFPGLKLLVVGDGGLRDALERHCRGLGIAEKVHFMGHRHDAKELMSIFDIFVLPSLREGLPMALLEAMAAKVPVIASAVGAIPHVIRDGVNGCLITPENVDQLANKIELLARDSSLRMSLAQEGFRTVVNNFSGERMAKKYLNIYLDLMGYK